MTLQSGPDTNTTYNISNYRHTCRTCKDMETEVMNYMNTQKNHKLYGILGIPNKSNGKAFSTLQLRKMSLD